MFSHGYIENDFDVHEWAAPEFLEQAAEELIAEQWKKMTTIKLPETSELQMTHGSARLVDAVIFNERAGPLSKGGRGAPTRDKEEPL